MNNILPSMTEDRCTPAEAGRHLERAACRLWGLSRLEQIRGLIGDGRPEVDEDGYISILDLLALGEEVELRRFNRAHALVERVERTPMPNQTCKRKAR